MAKKPTPVGEVIHVFSKIGVAVIKFSKPVADGDKIHVVGHSDDFTQTVESMQIDHKSVKKVKKGEEAGMKMDGKVHEGDKVFLEE